MISSNPIASTIILIFGLQAIILLILLVRKQPRELSHSFLAVLLFFFAAMCINISWLNYLITNDQTDLYAYIQIELQLGIGPALYLFTKSITLPRFRFSRIQWLHFLPVTLEFLYFRTEWYRNGFYFRQEMYDSGFKTIYDMPFEPNNFIYILIMWMANISALIYIFLALKALFDFEKSAKNYYSNLKNHSLAWLRIPILFYSFFWVLWILLRVVDQVVYGNQYQETYFLISITALSAVTCWIGFKGYVHVNSKDLNLNFTNESTNSPAPNPDLADRLTSVMETEKPYLKPDLDLASLAEMANLNVKITSQIINKVLGTNFYELINRYRIEEFKKRVKNGEAEKLSLIGLAFECGFNSKSTFNHVFKKNTGMTPKEFTESSKK